MRLSCVPRPPARVQALIRLVDGPSALDDLPPPLRAVLSERLQQAPATVLPSLGLLPQPVVAAVRAPRWSDAVESRRRGGALARALTAERIGSAAIAAAGLTAPFLIGFDQGAYAWDRYQPKPAPRLTELVLLAARADAAQTAAMRQAAWVARCRDLVNTPAEELGPEEFVAIARPLARAAGIRVRLLDERACTRLGMGCLLAVGRASARRPRLLVLELPGRDRRSAPLALCGKGVCFDTGGLNLKNADGMALMRKDMGGAASVLCALLAAAEAGRPARTVRAYLPLVENAIGPAAFRQGDVLRAMDGTTVEIGHTDAEGRLILADAVALARREGAGAIVSVATLTGAAMTALGRVHVPLLATDDALAATVLAAAQATGEKLWRLPLDHEHKAIIRGQVAQLNNAPGGGEAGCITAGAFIAHFAGDTPFAHLDISPASWMPKAWELGPAGATGTIVTTLTSLACG